MIKFSSMSREAPYRQGPLRFRGKNLLFAAVLSSSLLFLLYLSPFSPRFPPPFGHHHHHPPPGPPRPGYAPNDQPAPGEHQFGDDILRSFPDPAFPPNLNPVACRGARGVTVSTALDLPRPVYSLPNITYPDTTIGGYEAIGLEKTWFTAEARYGPYGYGENREDYNFSRVDWGTVNWGRLQHDCIITNRQGKPGEITNDFDRRPRLRYMDQGSAPPRPKGLTGRQAIVLRSWSTYDYQPEDMWNIRSIITEASLATGGQYEVILLVDVKDRLNGPLIHTSDAIYDQVLRASVPAEFQDIAVLFDKSIQLSLYPKIDEIRPVWQIMQPFQILAHFYPEFDHFWQIELDARFTGDVGKMLQAFHTFSTNAPYKQARERASWAYMPRLHGTYQDLAWKINKSMEGNATIWGPVRIKNFEPVAKPPPMSPREDNFEWGVGTEADLLLMTSLQDVNKIETPDDWVFRDWYLGGFDKGAPRWVSAPAQARASWTLLETTHLLQQRLGLRVPSEATLPSFALWNGLKVIGLPIPNFQFPERDLWELHKVFNGKQPKFLPDGLARGPGRYRTAAVAFFMRPMTWAWWSSLPDPIFEHWFKVPVTADGSYTLWSQEPHDAKLIVVPPELPSFMANVSGEIYVPAFMLHPRKTNHVVTESNVPPESNPS